jgi:hypothetical protein
VSLPEVSRRYRLYLLLFRCRWFKSTPNVHVGLYPTRALRLWLRRGHYPQAPSSYPPVFDWWAFGPLEVRRFRRSVRKPKLSA